MHICYEDCRGELKLINVRLFGKAIMCVKSRPNNCLALIASARSVWYVLTSTLCRDTNLFIVPYQIPYCGITVPAVSGSVIFRYWYLELRWGTNFWSKILQNNSNVSLTDTSVWNLELGTAILSVGLYHPWVKHYWLSNHQAILNVFFFRLCVFEC